ncbi:MAG: YheT family hydrolase [Hydrogenophaga sp.]
MQRIGQLATQTHGQWPYRAPWWLPGGQVQTLWAALVARAHLGVRPRWQRTRWNTPDADFIDLDFAQHDSAPDAPLLVLFHGLEGSSASPYALAFADWAAGCEVGCVVPHFRGCSGEVNLAPRAYHSGDVEEIDWILRRLATEHPQRPLVAAGVSLGGNALLKWAGEMGAQAASVVRAVAAVCSPLDLAAGGQAIGQGFNRLVYTPMFLRTMVPKALQKLAQYPGLFDRQALLAVRDLHDFDDLFTAPLHGFEGVEDYWLRASARWVLPGIRVPALALNAGNDPFVPASSLPDPAQVSPWVTLWQPRHGGHVGFTVPVGRTGLPGHVRAMPEAVGRWLLQHV